MGIYIYLYGVEVLYPMNAITQIIYNSRDLGGRTKYHRVPSTFLSAHAYGGTMLSSMPYLIDRLAGVAVRRIDRSFAAAGVVAAAGGLLLCGRRLPLIVLGLTLVGVWVLSRLSLKVALLVAVVVGAGLVIAGTDERLQRAATLGDAEHVSQRITGQCALRVAGINDPLSGGGRAGVGCWNEHSVFLADLAPEPIGAENEYCRIVIEQGWFGLSGWLARLGGCTLAHPRHGRLLLGGSASCSCIVFPWLSG